MSERTHDPVHRASYAFEPDGDDLIVDTWLQPGGALPPHMHPRQEERWSVVDGTVRFQLGSDKRVIGPEDGEMVVAPNTKHGLTASQDSVAHLRCRVTPARDLQAFLEDSAAAAREGLFMKGGIPKNLRGARWAADFLARHRADVVMASPPGFVLSAMIAVFGSKSARTPSATMGSDAH